MVRIIAWIKQNKLTTFLLVVVGYLLVQYQLPLIPFLAERQQFVDYGSSAVGGMAPITMMAQEAMGIGGIVPPQADFAPVESQERLVVKETFLSLLVKDVAAAIREIEAKAKEAGGFLVDSQMLLPEGAATGSISVRVSEDKRTEALDAFKALGVRVVSENVSGRDVTDEYVDIEARLEVLSKTKAKFEEILNQATRVQDLMEVQRELINIQAQVDGLKGQQKYLEQSAKLSRITVYLSTDELGLPYTPDQPWRPQAIFKLAVRSLIANVRKVGTGLIWVGVYAPVWVPLAAGFWWWQRRKRN